MFLDFLWATLINRGHGRFYWIIVICYFWNLCNFFLNLFWVLWPGRVLFVGLWFTCLSWFFWVTALSCYSFNEMRYYVFDASILLQHFLMVALALALRFGLHELRQAFEDLCGSSCALIVEVPLKLVQEGNILLILFQSPAMIDSLLGSQASWLK